MIFGLAFRIGHVSPDQFARGDARLALPQFTAAATISTD